MNRAFVGNILLASGILYSRNIFSRIREMIKIANVLFFLIYHTVFFSSPNLIFLIFLIFLISELGISNHDLVYCTRKTPSLKPNKQNDISVRSMKTYTKEKLLELLSKTDFPDYTTFACLNKAYKDFKWSDWFTFPK